MFPMGFYIRLGEWRLLMVDSIHVKESVENLADVAIITLPASRYNRAMEVEDKLSEGNRVVIRFGYGLIPEELPVEFEGYIESIDTDDGSIRLNCEDELYNFRKDIPDKVLTDVTVKQLLQHVIKALGGGFSLECDYDFKYNRFTIYQATGYDVLKKVQEETKANIYLKGKTLHVHPQYLELGEKVIYDFAVNIEKSELKYQDARKRKFQVTVEGTDPAGKTVKVIKGTPGGDKITIKIPGVWDRATLEKRADEQLKISSYTGYEGDFTGWLVPAVKPAGQVVLRDADYEYKTGRYYVVGVESRYEKGGGSRKVTVGKKLGDE